MQNNKKHLNIIKSDENGNQIIAGTTCFAVQSKYNVDCQRKKCQHWINHSQDNNCVVIATQKGPKTLQEVGQIYDLTRMRICQIEKNVIEKIKKLHQ
jgi:hypothetical protein